MLQVLEFSITTPTSYRFLERFKKLAQVDDRTFFFAQYLQEIAMLDASLLKYKPSELAAGCLLLSAQHLQVKCVWSEEMERTTKIAMPKRVVEDVRCFVVEVNPKFLTTLKYKFSKVEYM